MQSKNEILKTYKVVGRLGEGCFSKVYLALDQYGMKIALKVIQKNKFSKEEEIEKIIVEKEILKMMDHRGILKLYKTMQTNTKVYLALEYAEYGNLLNLINRIKLKVTDIQVIIA